MEKRDLRTCAVCYSSYKFCPRCSEDANKEPWHFTFCSSNCKNIYDVTSSFEDGRISKDEAASKLKDLDLSKREYFGKSYKDTISKILKTEKVIIKDKKEEVIPEVQEQPKVKPETSNGKESKDIKK